MAEARDKSKRHIRSVLITATVFVLFACCGGLFVFGNRPENGIHVAELEADLRRSLPEGSTWAQTEAWFLSHGIRTGEVSELNGRKVGLWARIPNHTWFESAEIRISVYFNESGGLQKIIIYRFVFSL
jgi:hypothetical protein